MPDMDNLEAPHGAVEKSDQGSPEAPDPDTGARLSDPVGMRGELVWMALSIAATWGVLALPSYLVAGSTGLRGLSYSVLICGITSFLSTLLCHYRTPKGPEAVSLAFVMCSCVRVPFLLLAAILLQELYADFELRTFGIWLILSYVMTFSIDVFLVARWLRSQQTVPG